MTYGCHLKLLDHTREKGVEGKAKVSLRNHQEKEEPVEVIGQQGGKKISIECGHGNQREMVFKREEVAIMLILLKFQGRYKLFLGMISTAPYRVLMTLASAVSGV